MQAASLLRAAALRPRAALALLGSIVISLGLELRAGIVRRGRSLLEAQRLLRARFVRSDHLVLRRDYQLAVLVLMDFSLKLAAFNAKLLNMNPLF